MDVRTIVTKAAREPQFAWFMARKVTERFRGRLRGHPTAQIAVGVRIGGPGRLSLGARTRIKDHARIFVGPGAQITLGDGSNIGTRNIINIVSGLQIGTGSRLSWDCQLLDTDFHETYDEAGNARTMTRPIVIGDRVLIGTGALILKGVTIGDDAIVGAGSVVARDVPPRTIVAGNPAVVVGKAHGWAPGRA